jgi:dolichol-phosphate mannosyltransferase
MRNNGSLDVAEAYSSSGTTVVELQPAPLHPALGLSHPEIAIVIPTLNEAGNVARIVEAIDQAMGQIRYEIIFVDDWSVDGTVAEVGRVAAGRHDIRVISRFGRKGLASAVIEGALSSFAPVIAVMDGDMQHDEAILPALYARIAEGHADVAIGSRYCAEGSFGDWQESRIRASQMATKAAQFFLTVPVTDPMSGFFAIRRESLLKAVPKLSQLGFKILLDILLSSDSTIRVAELPYKFRNRVAGESKLDGMVIVQYIQLLLDKKIGRFCSPRLVFFGAVGAFGLLVHLAILSAMINLAGLAFPVSQTIAVTFTICVNFLLNNELTYHDRRLRGRKLLLGLVTFYGICSLGAIANVGAGSFAFANHYSWWVSGIAGAVVGSAWNYMASRMLTWRTA